jgi:hypothetical protein
MSADVVRTLRRFGWPILYVTTVAAMLWWYEIRPANNAVEQMQGAWQVVEGEFPDQQFTDDYLYIDRNETWSVYPKPDRATVHRSRIEVRPADNFFVVRRAFGFDYGNTRETEYIVCLKNHQLYILRGLAQLESVRKTSVEKLRRVDALPDEVEQSIKKYLDRIERAAPDEPNRPDEDH